jgi:Pectate lyase superfamily protein
MTYLKQTWTDHVTTVDKVHMDHIEDGIVAAASLGQFNVKAYGAKGDGQTDDYAAIMAAYNAMPAGGGVLIFPEGGYVHRSPLSFTAAKPLVIRGAGAGVTSLTYVAAAGGVDAITINGPLPVTVSDLTIVQPYFTDPGGYLLTLNGSNAPVRLERLNLYNGSYGGCFNLSNIPGVYVSSCSARADRKGIPWRLDGVAGYMVNSGGLSAPVSFNIDARPPFYLTNTNSLEVANCGFGGVGPRAVWAINSITSTASSFTVTTASNHDLRADDLLVVKNASVAAYNNCWRIASVTANTITVNTPLNPGAAGAQGYAQTAASMVYISNESGPVNENSFSNCLFAGSAAATYGEACVWMDGRHGGSPGYHLITGYSFDGNYYDNGTIGILLSGGVYGSSGPTMTGISITGGVHNNPTCQLQIDGPVSNVSYDNVAPSGGGSLDDGVSPSAAVRIYGGTEAYKPQGIRLRGSVGQTRWYSGGFVPYKYGVLIDDAGQATPPQDITIVGAELFGSVQAVGFTGGGSSLAARRYVIRQNHVNQGAAYPQTNANFLPSITSAATIDLSNYVHDTIKITGSTNISTINGGWIGREVTLLCVSALSFVTGGNLALAANYPVLAGQLVRASFDGTSWFLR